MTLQAMPGNIEGGLIPRHLNPRPCTNLPSWWWDMGDPHNEYARELCRTECPVALFAECEAGPKVFGMVKAGVLYDDKGKPVPEEHKKCRNPNCRKCARVVSDHHDLIAALRADSVPFREIAERLGFTPDAVRMYWSTRGKARAEREAQQASEAA